MTKDNIMGNNTIENMNGAEKDMGAEQMNNQNRKHRREVTITFGKKATAIFMSTLLSAMLLAGCSGTQLKTNSDYEGQTVMGEVTEVAADSITIDVMEMNGKMGEKPDMNSNSSGNDEKDQSESNDSSGNTAEAETVSSTTEAASVTVSTSDSTDVSESSTAETADNSDTTVSSTAETADSSENTASATAETADSTDSSDKTSATGETADSTDSSDKAEVKDKKTGDTAKITIDEDTEITKNSMGPGGMGGPQGQPPQGNNSDDQSGKQSDNDSNGQDQQNGSAPSGQPPQGQPPQNGEAPSGQPPQGQPPANGNESSDQSSQGQPPANGNGSSDQSSQVQPSQNDNGGNSSQMPGNAQGETIELSDIEEGDKVAITINDDGEAESVRVFSDNGNAGGSQDAQNIEYSAVKTYEEDASISGETIESTGDDENGVLVKGGDVDLEDVTVTRNSDSSTGGDNASFYGLSAAVLGTDGNTYVTDSKINTDADGGAGIFAYGDGTVYASDTTIKTSNGASGGIHAAGGGTLYAWDLDVTTSGQSSAAIRSDRGGGTMVVDGGSYTSKGVGSPAIYSTADVTVNDADLEATGSEAICIEGKNTVRLFDSSLTGNMSDDSQNDCTWNVILYQSMSGDSEEGTSEFEMDGGELTAKNGGMFYTTNTSSKFVLKDVDITYADENDFFLKATGNSNQRGWGQSGSNGADCDFTAISQEMEGDVIWDKISKLDFYMTDGSTLTGAVVKDNSNAGSGKGGSCNVYIDSDSTWTVTGNSTLTNLYNAGKIVDASGNKVTIKDTDGTVYVKGTSKYTITVKTYSTEDKTEDADSISSWSEYKVEKPSQL